MQNRKKRGLVAVAVLCLLLCACAKTPQNLYTKLLDRFAQAGYTATLVPVPEGQPVGIMDASYWQQLAIDGIDQPVLVYFDESNRADYLQTFVDASQFGYVTRFGQRFVLSYAGTDAGILTLLQSLNP